MDSEDCLVVRSIIDLVEDSRQLMDTLQVLQASQVALVSQLEPFLNGKEYYNCLKGFIEIHKYYLNRKRAKGYGEAMKAGLVGRPAKTDEIEKAIHLYHTQAFSINEIEKLSGVSSSNIAVNGVDRYQSYANKLGNITKHKDLLNKQLYNYEYDINGRLVRQSVEDTSKGYEMERNLYLLEYAYVNMDNISGFINKVGKKAFKHSYAYTADNLLNTYTMPTGKIVSYSYDGLNRLKQYQMNTATPLTVAYEYEASKRNTNGGSTFQTTKVSQETVGNKGIKYTYDMIGNIASISEKNSNGTYDITNSYQYDELNQLVREDDVNQGKTKVYTYDLGGNIISIKEYAYTLPEEEASNLLNTVTYEYTDTNWKNKLTSYNGFQ